MRFLRLLRSAKDILPTSQAARLLAEAFRSLGTLCARTAELLEAQRLARSGYGAQGKFLERLEQPRSPAGPPTL